MAPHSIAVAVLALGACWGKPQPPAPPAPKPPAPIAPAKPRGIVLVAHVPPTKSDPVVFWNDFDANKTGEILQNVTRHLRPVTNATNAAWFSADDEVLSIARPPQGIGVVASELATDRIWAVSPDGKRAIIGCVDGRACSIGTLDEAGVIDERALAAPNAVLKAWLSDGRLVYEEAFSTPTMFFVEPKTEMTTRGLKLVMPFRQITDDGSLIAWFTELSHGKQVVRWKRLRDEHEMSIEVAGSAIDCRFTPISRVLYCVVAPVTARRATDEDPVIHNRLVLIDPVTGKSRELAGDLPLLDAHFTSGSPDGRYVAYTSNVEDSAQRPMIVDVLSGETFPIGPPAVHAYVVGWLAPR